MQSLPRLKCLSLLRSQKKTNPNHLKQIHAQLITNGLKSLPILANLIESYCSSSVPSFPNYAHQVVLSSDHPNIYLLNVLIRSSQPRFSIQVFSNWVSKFYSAFDDSTYTFVLGACARSPSLLEGKQIHARIVKHGFHSNIMVQTTNIHFYASNRDITSARKVFDEMPQRSSVTWNAMLKGYCSQRERAEEHGHEALTLFQAMLVDESSVKPTETTIVCVLSGASQLGILETGVCIHGYIEKTIGHVPENDVYIGTGLVDMYSKCGCLESALCVFNRMREVKNVLTWTAMATGLAIHGRGEEVLELLDSMEESGTKPNEVTFTSLLFACCHGGLVEEGLTLFHDMDRKHGIKPLIQHYGCIVDLLARAGLLEEAYEFIARMEVEPDVKLWRSLLNACNVYGDVVMGERVGKILLQTQPKHSLVEDYVGMSNVYALAGRWGDVEMVRGEMKTKGIETKPGWSSVHTLNKPP